MADQSAITLILLLAVYGAGILWVIGVCVLAAMKFTGVLDIGRPVWIFKSPQRALGVGLCSATMLLLLDALLKRFEVIQP